MFKLKNVFLISLLVLILISTIACPGAIIEGPDDSDDPWQYGGEIEIMYVRVKEVVSPSGSDPTGTAIYHNKYGGENSSSFVPNGEDTWIASVLLECEPQPYYIWTVDAKVNTTYTSVGEKFFLRLKKEGALWVELTCIVDSPAGGKSSKFVFYNGKLQNPTNCSTF